MLHDDPLSVHEIFEFNILWIFYRVQLAICCYTRIACARIPLLGPFHDAQGIINVSAVGVLAKKWSV